jgi:hypothetical protein
VVGLAAGLDEGLAQAPLHAAALGLAPYLAGGSACYAHDPMHELRFPALAMLTLKMKIQALLCLPLAVGLSLAHAKGEFKPQDQLSICEWADADEKCQPLTDASLEQFKVLPEDIETLRRIQAFAKRSSVTGDELVAAFGSPLGRIQPNRDVLLIWSMGEKIRPGTAVLILTREQTVVRTAFRVANEYSVIWKSPVVSETKPLADIKSPDAKP